MISDKDKGFVDYWENEHPDKTMYVQNWAESEYEVTYRNDAGDTFCVIFRPKKYPIGFHKEWR